jgi:hypothetical protein
VNQRLAEVDDLLIHAVLNLWILEVNIVCFGVSFMFDGGPDPVLPSVILLPEHAHPRGDSLKTLWKTPEHTASSLPPFFKVVANQHDKTAKAAAQIIPVALRRSYVK